RSCFPDRSGSSVSEVDGRSRFAEALPVVPAGVACEGWIGLVVPTRDLIAGAVAVAGMLPRSSLAKHAGANVSMSGVSDGKRLAKSPVTTGAGRIVLPAFGSIAEAVGVTEILPRNSSVKHAGDTTCMARASSGALLACRGTARKD